MSDQPQPPAWPGQAGTPDPATPAWPGAPAAPSEPPPPPPASPSWPSGRFRDRSVDLKLVIAVLIGLVSVTGAVVTWRSSQLNESATDKDRQAIAETIRQEQDAADIEVTLQDARTRVADHAAAAVSAEILDQQADRFAEAGDDAAARVASDEAEEQRAIAQSFLFTINRDLTQYVVVDEASGRRSLDETLLRFDLEAQSQARSQVDPTQTVREANRLRDESQHFDGWLVPLVSAVVLLTLAEFSRQRILRLAVTGAATAVWIVSAVLAFGGR